MLQCSVPAALLFVLQALLLLLAGGAGGAAALSMDVPRGATRVRLTNRAMISHVYVYVHICISHVTRI
jgi:hypothetical protein